MKLSYSVSAIVLALASIAATGAEARDQIRIVGSSTVYPFASYVAEEFKTTTKFGAPIVESTGSGGGHKLFGQGLGKEILPQVTDAAQCLSVMTAEVALGRNVANRCGKNA